MFYQRFCQLSHLNEMMLKKAILKLTVNIGQVMYNGQIWPLKWVDKSLVKYIVFLCIIYCVTKAVAVMHSRNIPMAEKRSVCLESKKVKYVGGFNF